MAGLNLVRGFVLAVRPGRTDDTVAATAMA